MTEHMILNIGQSIDLVDIEVDGAYHIRVHTNSSFQKAILHSDCSFYSYEKPLHSPSLSIPRQRSITFLLMDKLFSSQKPSKYPKPTQFSLFLSLRFPSLFLSHKFIALSSYNLHYRKFKSFPLRKCTNK